MRALALAALVMLVAACGADTTAVGDPVAGKSISPLSSSLLPTKVLDLNVTSEDVSDQLATQNRAFVRQVSLFGLRKGDLLKATLQVSVFNDEAKLDRAAFRNRILRDIGRTVPQEVRLGDERVHVTTGNRQTIAVWFKGDDMLILSVRADYEQPRSLLRAVLDLDPGGVS
jgi:hypothetical protein